jgi:DNA primase
MNHYRKQRQVSRLAQSKTKLTANCIKNLILPKDFYDHELQPRTFKKRGWNEAGLCPFHHDNQSGSFFVNLNSGAYKCFSCGAAGGDVISFIMVLYGFTFADALQHLANDWRLPC